jgi:hypothetical protein
MPILTVQVLNLDFPSFLALIAISIPLGGPFSRALPIRLVLRSLPTGPRNRGRSPARLGRVEIATTCLLIPESASVGTKAPTGVE